MNGAMLVHVLERPLDHLMIDILSAIPQGYSSKI